MSKQLPLLLLCVYEENGPKTILEHIDSLKFFSKHSLEVYNLYQENSSALKFKCFNLNKYAGLIIHNTLSYSMENVEKLSKRFTLKLKEYQGVKIIFKQDEMRNVNQLKHYITENKFDLLFSCVPEKSIEMVYGDIDVKVVNMLTGYVTDEMRSYKFSQLDTRKIDIFYRGMKLPYFFGELSYEKFLIGEKFKDICKTTKFLYDISSEMEDRVYGDEWISLLADSKAVLGVESGGSVFDFDACLEKNYVEVLKLEPKISFYEYQDKYLKGLDGEIEYNQISPRHFEAAATKTVQILFEGEYSGIFRPYEHYIPLKKDFSNIDEVLNLLSDTRFRIDVTTRAFEEIIMNETYSYSAFVELFDRNVIPKDSMNLNKRRNSHFYIDYILLPLLRLRGIGFKIGNNIYHRLAN